MLSKTCVRADNVNTVIIIYGGVTVFVVIIFRGLNVLEINTEVVVRNLISIISGKKKSFIFLNGRLLLQKFFWQHWLFRFDLYQIPTHLWMENRAYIYLCQLWHGCFVQLIIIISKNFSWQQFIRIWKFNLKVNNIGLIFCFPLFVIILSPDREVPS